VLPKIICGIQVILPFSQRVRKGNGIILTLQIRLEAECQLNDIPKVREMTCIRARVWIIIICISDRCFSLQSRLMFWRRKASSQSQLHLWGRDWSVKGVLAKCFSFLCLCKRSCVCSNLVKIQPHHLIRSCCYLKTSQHSHIPPDSLAVWYRQARMALNVKICFSFLCVYIYQRIIK